jgi:hypothetical protein
MGKALFNIFVLQIGERVHSDCGSNTVDGLGQPYQPFILKEPNAVHHCDDPVVAGRGQGAKR